MPRIACPSALEDAPPASRQALQTLQAAHGNLHNLHRVLAASPPALQAYLGMQMALSQSTLSAQTRERIALTTAEFNRCEYCLAAHVSFARALQLNDAEITANRNGASNDPKADAALRLAAKILRSRGHLCDADLSAARDAGYDDAQILEITALAALNCFTNFINEVAGTKIDFPRIQPQRAP